MASNRESASGFGWLAFALASMVCWGIFGFLSKITADKFDPAGMQLLITIGMILLAIPALARTKGKPGTRLSGVACGLAIGFVSTVAFLAYNAALAKGSAVVIVPLTALYPLVTLVLALVLLKERLRAVQLVGILFSLLAIVILST